MVWLSVADGSFVTRELDQEELIAHHLARVAAMTPSSVVTSMAMILMNATTASKTKQHSQGNNGDDTKSATTSPSSPTLPDDLSAYEGSYGNGCGGPPGEPAFVFTTNTELERMLGYSPEEMVHSTFCYHLIVTIHDGMVLYGMDNSEYVRRHEDGRVIYHLHQQSKPVRCFATCFYRSLVYRLNGPC
jgi:PAS domain-containing protein